jgi:hypothetical protein
MRNLTLAKAIMSLSVILSLALACHGATNVASVSVPGQHYLLASKKGGPVGRRLIPRVFTERLVRADAKGGPVGR